jgi:hypothetical protein
METNDFNPPVAQLPQKRPVLVTVLCILGFIGITLSIIGAFALRFMQDIPELEVFGALPPWYPIFALVISILNLIALIYIWKMRKVGVIALTGLFVFNIVVALLVSPSLVLGETIFSFVINAIAIGLFWIHYGKMS